MNPRARDIGVTALKGCGCLFIILVVAVVLFPIFATNSGSRASPCMSSINQISKAILSYAGDYDDKLPCTRASGVANGLQPEQGIEARPGVVPFGGATWVERIDPYVQKGSIEDAKYGHMTGVFSCPKREEKWPEGVGQDVPDWHSYGYNFLYLGLPWNGKDSPKTNPYRAWKFTAGTPKVAGLDDTSETILLVESRSIWAFPPFTHDGRHLSANRTCISPRHNDKVNIAFCDGHVKAVDAVDLVTNGRTAKNRQTGRALDNRLWDPAKTRYPEAAH